MDTRLAKKGQGEPRAGLIEQGHVHAELARQYEAELAAAGWTKRHTEGLAEAVRALETLASLKADRSRDAQKATVAEHAAIDEAKTFVRRLRNAVPMAFRTAPGLVEPSAFHAGGRLARSTPRLVKYLGDIRCAVVKLDDALAPYLSSGYGGKKASEVLDEVKRALTAADAAQETALTALPRETLAVYEQKGRLLEAIEDMNRVAKIAFDGDAAAIARFNKDVLLRARRQRWKPAVSEPNVTG